MRRRGGTTLTEIVVVAGLVVVMATLALGSWQRGGRQDEHLDFRLKALNAALVVRQRMADDLAASIPGPSGEGIQVDAATSATVTFHRVRNQRGAGAWDTCVDTDFAPVGDATEVSYRFDDDSGKLLRNGRVLGANRFDRVTFQIVPLQAGSVGQTLAVTVTILPNRGFFRDETDREARAQTVAFSLLCERATFDGAYDDFALLR